MKKACACAAFLVLSACAAAPSEKASTYCDELGYAPGTYEYRSCHMEMTQHYAAIRMQSLSSALLYQGLSNFGRGY